MAMNNHTRPAEQNLDCADVEICVIVTCYGQPSFLPEAISSALLQNPLCKIVLVNDGCPYEETHRYCTLVRTANSERVLYWRQPNRGPAAARNSGIELALRAWPALAACFFLDGDNRLGPLTIRKMYDGLIHNESDWTFTDLTLLDGRGIMGMAGTHSAVEQMTRNYMDTGSLVSRRVLDAGIRFDPGVRQGIEDWDFWLTASRLGFRGAYVPASGFLYRRRPESLLTSARRDYLEIIGQLRRKHRSWINPRNAVQFEHLESPRYALLLHGSDRVILFTDPRDLSRTIDRAQFLERLVWHGAQKRLGRFPAYLISSSQEVLEELRAAKLLSATCWQLETQACQLGASVATAASKNGEGSIAMTPVAYALYAPEYRSLSVPSLSASSFEEVTYNNASAELRNNVIQIRSMLTQHKSTEVFLGNSSSRLKIPAALQLRTFFDIGTLFPVSEKTWKTGFLVRGVVQDHSYRLLIEYATAAARAGSSHLFWIDPEAQGIEAARKLFDTITPLRSKSRLELLGLLGGMNLVVNHQAAEFLHLAGGLKHLDVCMATSIHKTTVPAVINHAISYEYVTDVYLANSLYSRKRLQALGIPLMKISCDLEIWIRQRSNRNVH